MRSVRPPKQRSMRTRFTAIVFSGKFGRIDAQGIHWCDVLLDRDCLILLSNFSLTVLLR